MLEMELMVLEPELRWAPLLLRAVELTMPSF